MSSIYLRGFQTRWTVVNGKKVKLPQRYNLVKWDGIKYKTDHRVKIEARWANRRTQVLSGVLEEQANPKWFRNTIRQLNRRKLLTLT